MITFLCPIVSKASFHFFITIGVEIQGLSFIDFSGLNVVFAPIHILCVMCFALIAAVLLAILALLSLVWNTFSFDGE